MAISLYDITVPAFLQVVTALRTVLAKGQDFAEANGIDPDTLVQERLIEDMFPLGLQIQRVADHSAGALRDVSKGAFTMPSHDLTDFLGLTGLLTRAEAELKSWSREAVEALEGRPFVFDTGSSRTEYSAEAFLLSFSIPNFYFHAVTAYDILRAKGVPIGKRDYMSSLRTRLG